MDNMKQMLLVFQGPSGSGKSTMANKLVKEYENAVIYSTDDLFHENGIYNFNAKLLGVNHQKNLERSVQALKEGKTVLIDNTNLSAWECGPYVKAAVELGIEVKFVRCEGRYKNIHGVPEAKVQQMWDRMEDLTVERCLAAKKPF